MSPPPTMPPLGPQRRPATVTVGCAALVVVGALYLALAALSLSIMDGVKERFVAAAQNIEGTPDSAIERSATFFTIGTAAGVVMGLVLAVVTVVLALFNLRGRNVSRILTWVVCGGFALCGLCSLQFGVVDITSRAPDLLDAFDAAYPGWYLPTSTALTICQVALMIGVAVLLALPASNTFFRRTPATTAPPSFPPAPPTYPGI